MISLVSIYAGGSLTLLMALFHTRFYRLFGWKNDFTKISPLNTRIIYTVHLALLLLFFILAALSIGYARELSQSTGLSFGLNILISLFWLWRFLWQLFYFKREKGKKIPPMAIALIVVFLLLAIAYLIPVMHILFPSMRTG